MAGSPPPPVTRISSPEGIITVRMALRSLPPPPLLIDPQRAMESMDRLGEDTGQTRLKGMTEEEDERSQIAHVMEKRSTDSSHTKLRPSANKRQMVRQ